MKTLLLNRSDTERLLDPKAAFSPMRQAFLAHSTTAVIPSQRHRSDLAGPGTATVLFPGIDKAIPAYSVKVHAKFPAEDPAIRGALLLFDGGSGRLLAVMDSTYLTAVRTGLASAIAAHALAREDASTVAVIGAGKQGRFQLQYLHLLRPLHNVRVFDTNERRGEELAREVVGMGIDCTFIHSVKEAVRDADIVLSATWARTPFLTPELIGPGTHISTLGADEPGKAEVSAELIRKAIFVCDDRDLAVRMGAIGNVGLTSTTIAAELGEVLSGVHPGRTKLSDITMFASVGLPFQDVVVAWQIYQAALERGIGTPFDFLE